MSDRREPRSCDTVDLEIAEDELRDAARGFASVDDQLGMYADTDKRMDAEKLEARNATRANLRQAAFRLAVAELETEFPATDSNFPERPDVDTAIDHLKDRGGI